jgi:hypothetical protein
MVKKVVVFDLDETLGYFIQLSFFWKLIMVYLKKNNEIYKLNQEDFNNVLDLYPEFIRPDMYSILKYLEFKKKENLCDNVMIYTNNQFSKKWVYLIKKYFEYKINYNIFDNIICAFKINNQRVEMLRSSHEKTYNDFIRCTKLPKNTQICFIDDNYYPDMDSNIIYYINVKSYIYNLKIETIIHRFLFSIIGKNIIKNENNFIEFIRINTFEYNKSIEKKDKKEYEIDKIITKKIFTYLEEFFNE